MGVVETCIWSVAAGPVPIPKGGMKNEPRATALPEWWSRVTARWRGSLLNEKVEKLGSQHMSTGTYAICVGCLQLLYLSFLICKRGTPVTILTSYVESRADCT